mmetsp:Transcript_10194/g.33409  ORF Transcript_10194/g.33409 Transcript_10194/m.33409 type:complete len:265 (-) Transcript_10194:236-1030(-)
MTALAAVLNLCCIGGSSCRCCDRGGESSNAAIGWGGGVRCVGVSGGCGCRPLCCGCWNRFALPLVCRPLSVPAPPPCTRPIVSSCFVEKEGTRDDGEEEEERRGWWCSCAAAGEPPLSFDDAGDDVLTSASSNSARTLSCASIARSCAFARRTAACSRRSSTRRSHSSSKSPKHSETCSDAVEAFLVSLSLAFFARDSDRGVSRSVTVPITFFAFFEPFPVMMCGSLSRPPPLPLLPAKAGALRRSSISRRGRRASSSRSITSV